ncbi:MULTISPECIES: acyl carrier protein [Streptomyces]|jgi:acyl carrier protein|uniref:acyl carrier protein n=1 Tax=Streptomyces TaxID=1883 RepID=UPI000A366586|nr:phosphopantetheine-binding protein [Streptomyces glaucescens]
MSTSSVIPDSAEILTRLRAALSVPLGDAVQGVAEDADLTEALGERYDSLAAMECITAVETQFGVEVDFVADDVRHIFSTLSRITEFVQGRLEDDAALRAASDA